MSRSLQGQISDYLFGLSKKKPKIAFFGHIKPIKIKPQDRIRRPRVNKG